MTLSAAESRARFEYNKALRIAKQNAELKERRSTALAIVRSHPKYPYLRSLPWEDDIFAANAVLEKQMDSGEGKPYAYYEVSIPAPKHTRFFQPMLPDEDGTIMATLLARAEVVVDHFNKHGYDAKNHVTISTYTESHGTGFVERFALGVVIDF